MFKKTLLAVSIFISAACSSPSQAVNVVNPIHLGSGFWQTVLIAEATTNFSSLLYDKTEADFEVFIVNPINMLPVGSSYYIVPSVYKDRYNRITIDETHSSAIKNYMKINNYGKIVKSVDDAEYVIIFDVKESLSKKYGKNTSEISFVIVDTDENPLFVSKVLVTGRSDSNFYYYPSKEAKPSSYLTMKGFEKIFTEALPQAFS